MEEYLNIGDDPTMAQTRFGENGQNISKIGNKK